MKRILFAILLSLMMVSVSFAAGPLPPPPVGPTDPVYDNGTCTTTKTIDYNNAPTQSLLMGGNCQVSFVLPSSGYRSGVVLKVTQATGVHYNITWVSTKWESGLVPLITQEDGGVDFISCYVDSVGAYCTFGSDFH